MKSYEEAKERYAQYGVDTDEVLEAIAKVSISLHCRQGDDLYGFEGDTLAQGDPFKTRMTIFGEEL